MSSIHLVSPSPSTAIHRTHHARRNVDLEDRREQQQRNHHEDQQFEEIDQRQPPALAHAHGRTAVQNGRTNAHCRRRPDDDRGQFKDAVRQDEGRQKHERVVAAVADQRRHEGRRGDRYDR